MQTLPTHMAVSDFCADMESGTIAVNRRYQRSDRVWPITAQSFLIETLLRNYPLPKLYLHQKTDRVSKRSVREIIDGQQRATAIKAFFDDDLRLARNLDLEEARGKTYSQLPEALQSAFLNFAVGIDLFTNATEEEVREVFRRINSYEVPLNPEEQRHARFQGDFKWYIYHLSSQYGETFSTSGAFTERQLVRMADMKLLTEVTHAILHGITTTRKETLDRLYRENDKTFDEVNECDELLEDALDFLGQLDVVFETPLVRPYSLYSLLLAIMLTKHTLDAVDLDGSGAGLARKRDYERRLSFLSDAMIEGDDDGPLRPFVRATTVGTNTAERRRIRTEYFLDALSRDGGALTEL